LAAKAKLKLHQHEVLFFRRSSDFSVYLYQKKINLEDVSSFLGGDENPSNSRQLLPPDQALGRSEFCMQENQLHEETLGKALERAFPW